MKTKSKKTVSKRFKVTASGKLKHEVGQWNHLRDKKGPKVHERKGVERVIASKRQTRNLLRYISK